ncbi:MAG: DUF3987 domain-containing protein [Paludibacteraceae bacterium]|nr:DUF3987 domain-containing protein [Paludibacteraceae bacterium]
MKKILSLPAVPVSLQDSQDQDDLHIVDYLNLSDLPEPLQRMLSQAATPAERDMLLLATLTAVSACLPKLYFRYGLTGKRYYANLQCFILAAAASGKGIAGQALEMMQPVEAVYPSLIPGDSTFPAFFKRLYENGGHGYVHESEGTVITDIWRSQTATYNSLLRKAAEHEMISHNRCRELQVIPHPCLSVLLTGTFSQYRELVPSIENGYFSRLLPLIVRDTQPFDPRFVEADGHAEPVSRQVGEQLAKLCAALYAQPEQEWTLTPEQKQRLSSHLSTEYEALIRILGSNFHSAVVRMAIQIERIAMILSALRLSSSISPASDAGSTLSVDPELHSGTFVCSDTDCATAELIGSKLILHMAAAYKLIAGDRTELVPRITTSCQKQLLFSRLQSEYAHKELVAAAQSQGISSRTAFRWNDRWLAEGLITKAQYGVYKKIC